MDKKINITRRKKPVDIQDSFLLMAKKTLSFPYRARKVYIDNTCAGWFCIKIYKFLATKAQSHDDECKYWFLKGEDSTVMDLLEKWQKACGKKLSVENVEGLREGECAE